MINISPMFGRKKSIWKLWRSQVMVKEESENFDSKISRHPKLFSLDKKENSQRPLCYS